MFPSPLDNSISTSAFAISLFLLRASPLKGNQKVTYKYTVLVQRSLDQRRYGRSTVPAPLFCGTKRSATLTSLQAVHSLPEATNRTRVPASLR